MNDSYGVLADMYTALARERMHTMLTEASDDGLARQARCSQPSRSAARRVRVAVEMRRARSASLRWLRKGQLAGYPDTSATC